MTTITFGLVTTDAEVPADQNTVRRTTIPVDPDRTPAEQTHAPGFNETVTDSNPELGMNLRQLGSDWHGRERPVPPGAPVSVVDYNAIVDRQVSSSGQAAAKEARGEWGHGSMPWAVGIEPVLREGGAMGNDYFITHPSAVQDTQTKEWGVRPSPDQYTGAQDDISGISAYGRAASQDAAAREGGWYDRLIG